LSIILISIVGYFPLFKLQQWKIRNEIESKIENASLKETLSLISIPSCNATEIEWEEINKEFKYKGSMYDVVYFETKGYRTDYYCIKDGDETKLCSYLDEMVKKQMDENPNPIGSTGNNILKIFFTFFYVHSDNSALLNLTEVNKTHTPFALFYSSSFYNKITPPPKHTV
jgi:hypothetical protein